MPQVFEKWRDTERKMRGMYRAHPFPNRIAIPSNKSDERYRRIWGDFLRLPIDEFKNKTILDAGCGTGENTWVWRRLLDPSVRVIGVDQSEPSVTIARQRNEVASSPEFSVGSLLDLGLGSESVDLVFCSGVLVAIPDPDRAFQEISRVLKPGGYMVLVLYHKYGRAMHGLRREVIDLLEKEDADRRVLLAKQLFGRSMQKMAEKEQVPLEGMLYDQFGLLCESRYSVMDALKWFKQSNIDYLGTFPPVEWSKFGKALRFSHSLARHKQSWYYGFLLSLFPDNDHPSRHAPGFLTRATMETMWFFDQLQLFAISGRKKI
jgi:ubiquinone/menaquinone biosynthesis C-methylase UbiE